MLNVTRAIVYKPKTGNYESDQSVCSSIQQIKTGMQKIDEINNSVTALAYDIRTLTTDLRTVETKQKTMETSVQVMSDMFDDIKQKCDRFNKVSQFLLTVFTKVMG
jgi:CII-binding regulator of phage lambda lysogenization HflD